MCDVGAAERRLLKGLGAAALFLLAACSKAPTPTFHAEGRPEHLSDWGVVTSRNGVLGLSEGAVPYDLATPLFSDYASKLRTITLPEGEAAAYDAEDAFDLPVGTIISKTFYYPQVGVDWTGDVSYGEDGTAKDGALALGGLRLVETRILAHRKDGWVALAYVWNEAQTDAELKRAGAIVPLTLHRPDGRTEKFSYLVPNENQCAGCHATRGRAIEPIGIKARHLNKASTFAPGFNQLDHWRALGILDAPHRGAEERPPPPASAGAEEARPHALRAAIFPRNASWTDESASLDARARAYLDINCSHCHSDEGPAKTSGLDLRPSVPLGPAYGLCKSPIAAGTGTGGRRYDIVPGKPDESITVFRMETNEPGAMMPELGRAVVHEEGVALIRAWIAEMTGSCG